MADILIRGIEMPDSCYYCPMCYDMIECTVSPLQFWHGRPENEQFDFCNERHPDCPLHELQEHGDLIDRDAILHEDVVHYVDTLNSSLGAYVKFSDLVRGAPVIVPSNKEVG